MADRPESEALGGTEQQEVAGYGHQHRDQDAQMKPGPTGQDREVGVAAQALRVGDPGTLFDLARVHQGTTQQEVENLDGDDVEHDRAQDLVNASVGLQYAGHASPDRTSRGADEEREGQENEAGHIREAQHEQRREDRSRDDLALSPDVDHTRPERDGDAHPDQQEGHGLEGAVGQVLRPSEGTIQQSRVAGQGVGSQNRQHDRSDETRRQDGADEQAGSGKPGDDTSPVQRQQNLLPAACAPDACPGR